MCTAITFKTKNNYFGRTLDLEYAYNEQVTITPRNYCFRFRHVAPIENHYAIIGMATVVSNFPLYYDATNEKGLSMAALNFPGNATYYPVKYNFDNIAPFEFIPWVLGKCKNVKDVRKLLEKNNITDLDFSPDFPNTPLHWIIADKKQAITVETTADGMKIYDNPVGVLTNNPPFDFQMLNLSNYMNLTASPPVNNLSATLDLQPYSRGMGAIGLPGDWSSASRFVRAAFAKSNSAADTGEKESVSQFFHIMDTVAVPKGTVLLEGDKQVVTVYTSCCNVNKGIYYYTTYENRQISSVNMKKENLESSHLITYPLISEEQIYSHN